MSVKIQEIAELIERFAPPELAEDWDNIGLSCGDSSREVSKALVALDVTDGVINEAIQKGCGLIVTHHPIVLSGHKRVNAKDVFGAKMIKLIENRIAVYSAHTNLDSTVGGINDNLCKLLNIDAKPVKSNNLMRLGQLPKTLTLEQLAKYVKDTLSLSYAMFAGDGGKPVPKIAVLGGSGMNWFKDAITEGADVYITGDVRYHNANDALDLGLCLVDITHYGGEVTILPVLKRYLDDNLEGAGVEVCLSGVDGQPFRVV